MKNLYFVKLIDYRKLLILNTDFIKIPTLLDMTYKTMYTPEDADKFMLKSYEGVALEFPEVTGQLRTLT